MPTLNGKYNIKAVSKIIGVQPSTLRAWERRYQMIAPKRNHGASIIYRRAYSNFEMVNGQGFFRHDDWTSSSIIRRNRLQSNVQNEIHYDREVVLVDDLLQALLKFDEITTSALLNEAFSIYATEKVIASIVLQVSNKLLTLKIIMKLQWCNSNMSYHFYKRV